MAHRLARFGILLVVVLFEYAFAGIAIVSYFHPVLLLTVFKVTKDLNLKVWSMILLQSLIFGAIHATNHGVIVMVVSIFIVLECYIAPISRLSSLTKRTLLLVLLISAFYLLQGISFQRFFISLLGNNLILLLITKLRRRITTRSPFIYS